MVHAQHKDVHKDVHVASVESLTTVCFSMPNPKGKRTKQQEHQGAKTPVRQVKAESPEPSSSSND